jgi:hypothetical protein
MGHNWSRERVQPPHVVRAEAAAHAEVHVHDVRTGAPVIAAQVAHESKL